MLQIIPLTNPPVETLHATSLPGGVDVAYNVSTWGNV